MAVLEAWSHGLPVFMTDSCNLPEGFAAGAALRISTDPEAMADSLARGLASPDLPAIGGKGRQLVTDRFSWDAAARDYRATCDWVLGRAGKPDCIVSD